eukprot:scaffold2444_cov112-Isochrysis_galbana.AAC.3
MPSEGAGERSALLKKIEVQGNSCTERRIAHKGGWTKEGEKGSVRLTMKSYNAERVDEPTAAVAGQDEVDVREAVVAVALDEHGGVSGGARMVLGIRRYRGGGGQRWSPH